MEQKNDVVGYRIDTSVRVFYCEIIDDFNHFKDMSDVILVNRIDEKIKEVSDKIYTRDLFTRD